MAVRLSLNLANVAQSGQEIIFVTFSNSGKCLNSFWVYLIAPCCDDVSSVESTEVCLTGLVKKLSGHESTPSDQFPALHAADALNSIPLCPHRSPSNAMTTTS